MKPHQTSKYDPVQGPQTQEDLFSWWLYVVRSSVVGVTETEHATIAMFLTDNIAEAKCVWHAVAELYAKPCYCAGCYNAKTQTRLSLHTARPRTTPQTPSLLR
jgi:hypothetical protein